MSRNQNPTSNIPAPDEFINHEWNHFWPQWTCVKRSIGAANSWKKPTKKREVETLPAESGGTENVPTVWGSWAKNGEPWTLGWVSSRICAGDRREQEVMKHKWQDGRVSKYLSCALCFKLNKQNFRPFINYNLKDRKDKTQSMKVTNCAWSRSLTSTSSSSDSADKSSCHETKDIIKTPLITKNYFEDKRRHLKTKKIFCWEDTKEVWG